MNAGAYGGDIANVLDWAEIVDALRRAPPAGVAPTSPSPIAMPRLPPGSVVVRARLRAQPGDPPVDRRTHGGDPRGARGDAAGARAHRRLDVPQSAGGMKAWELIDAAGCRGLQRGGAQVSGEALQLPDQHGRARPPPTSRVWARNSAAASTPRPASIWSGKSAASASQPHGRSSVQ